ncbi:MAG TPA: DUF721 domain-containing protein [Candidatus Angelobacter sp.]|nr:DUF721 domain-containing protein [Candidatus Angelobacter sp.]
MNDLLRAQPPEEAVLLAWPVVCGNDVAGRTRALSFAEGKLTVEVQDAAWKSQLNGFTLRYVSVFAELLGPLVREITFQVVGKESRVAR